jgi:sialate O-acetylesterase
MSYHMNLTPTLYSLILVIWSIFTLEASLNSTEPLNRHLSLANIFCDHAVLQLGEPIEVWGKAKAKAELNLSFASKSYKVQADAQGQWSVFLDPCRSKDTLQLQVSSGDEQITIKDLRMGEVWLASGQSNMAFRVVQSDIQKNYPKFDAQQIRFFKSMVLISKQPEDEIYGEWKIANKTNSRDFSAVAFSYAVELHKKTGRPVGVIQSARGGSRCETWVPNEQLDLDHEYYSYPMKFVHRFERQNSKSIDAYYDRVAKWKEQNTLKATVSSPHEDFSGYIIRKPYGLYNAMIHPLHRYKIKGAIWYQGEGNSGEPTAYAYLFPHMIKLWRERWGYDFPFYFVQLPGFIRNDLKTRKSKDFVLSDHYQTNINDRQKWSVFREAQGKALSLSNTGMAITLDTGDPLDVHPAEKAVIGYRLAQLALKDTYDHDTIARGPHLSGKPSIQGECVTLTFDSAEGLKTSDGAPPKGFALASENMRFHWADQVSIKGNRIQLSSSQVAHPVAIRYAWVQFPELNLYNAAGLPMEPFRTDTWELK